MWYLIMKGADESKDAVEKQGIMRRKGLIYGLIFLIVFISQT